MGSKIEREAKLNGLMEEFNKIQEKNQALIIKIKPEHFR